MKKHQNAFDEPEWRDLQLEIFSAMQAQQQINRRLDDVWMTRASQAYQQADRRFLPVYAQYRALVDAEIAQQSGHRKRGRR